MNIRNYVVLYVVSNQTVMLIVSCRFILNNNKIHFVQSCYPSISFINIT